MFKNFTDWIFESKSNHIGYHYSNILLEIGEIIMSKQSKGLTYDLVWKIFKEECPEMPREFGYAYPIKKNLRFKYCYQVESELCIRGNFNYSVYFTMDALSSLNLDKKLPLKERLKIREEYIRGNAKKYFSDIEDLEKIELISDSWKITKIL